MKAPFNKEGKLWDIYKGLEQKLRLREDENEYFSDFLHLLQKETGILYEPKNNLFISNQDKEITISYGVLKKPLAQEGETTPGLIASEIIHFNKYIVRYALRDKNHTNIGYGRSEKVVKDISLHTETVEAEKPLNEKSMFFNTSSWSKSETRDLKRMIEDMMEEEKIKKEIYDY